MTTTSFSARLLATTLTACTILSSAIACSSADDTSAENVELDESSVAVVNGQQVGWAEVHRYVSKLYARRPIGDDSLRQIVTEKIVAREAEARSVVVTDDDVDVGLARLDAEARARTGKGLHDSIEAAVDDEELRAGMKTLLALEAVVRTAEGISHNDPLDPNVLNAWLAPLIEGAEIEERPLVDAVAATWIGGEISRIEVGRRILPILPREDATGIVSEMLGIMLVREEALARGVEITPDDATAEIRERDRILKRHKDLADTSYGDFVEASEKRSLGELLASEKFATEVLLGLFVAQDYTDDEVRGIYDNENFAARYDGEPFEEIEHVVRKQLRERIYRALYEKATIKRRL